MENNNEVKLNCDDEPCDTVDDTRTPLPITVVEARENPISRFLYNTTRGKVINLMSITLACVYVIVFHRDYTFTNWSENEHLQSIPFLLMYECVLHVTMLIAYIFVRTVNGSRSTRTLVVMVFSILLFTVMLSDLHLMRLTAITRLWLSHEVIRLQLKLISFVVEMSGEKVSETSSVSSFIYYLFAPTLIYQVTYPRSDTIRWRRVVNSIVWILITLMVIIPAFYAYILPHLVMKLTEITWMMVMKNLLIFLPLPFLVYAFLVSFMYFEMWCGLFGELMTFADHRFFGAYVKQRNAGDIFTSINSVVSNWIKKYLFIPVLKKTHSLLIAYTVTMALSASYHEIVYSFTLKQFIVMSHILGLAIGPQLLMKTTTRIARIIQISLFLFGFSTHFYPHILEYSARMYCDSDDSHFLRLIPLYVTCLKRVLLDEPQSG